MRFLWPKRSPVIQWSGSLIAILMVLFPLAPLTYQSFLDRPLYEAGGHLTLKNFEVLLTNPLFQKTALNSVIFALLSATGSVLLGALAAIFVNRTDLPLPRLCQNIFMWPFFVSPIIMIFGFILMYGPQGYVTNYIRMLTGIVPWNLYSIPGMAVTSAIIFFS